MTDAQAQSGSIFASVAIPAFDEGQRLPHMLHELERAGPLLPPVEFIVADDGSAPGDHARYEEAVAATRCAWGRRGAPHRISLLTLPRNRGKGAAIRTAWSQSASQAEWVGFVDADGAVPAAEVWRLIRRAAAGDADVIAGSRIRMAGRAIHRSLVRHLQGRVFATAVDVSFRLGFYDTQCGLKLVRSSLLRPLLPGLREERWMLDVELLLALRRAGARFVEEPIDWTDPGGSKVVPLLDPLRMLMAIPRMRRQMAPQSGAAPAPEGLLP
jgi:glycosyltransferase involved in cell wall biosynthesis